MLTNEANIIEIEAPTRMLNKAAFQEIRNALPM
jgi:hypothetical protein